MNVQIGRYVYYDFNITECLHISKYGTLIICMCLCVSVIVKTNENNYYLIFK